VISEVFGPIACTHPLLRRPLIRDFDRLCESTKHTENARTSGDRQ
jgi:hypothetical protein